MSKTSRTKIHYHKFARGKDISQYSEKDLSCIVGAGFIPVIDKESSTPNATQNGTTELALEPQEETIMEPKRSKHGRVLKPNTKAADAEEEDTRPRKKKSKEKSSPAGDDEVNPKSRREKRETAQSDGVDSSGEQPQENQADDLETSKRPKRKKKSKQQEVDQAVSSTHVKSKKAKVETILNEEGTAPSSKRTRKANKELAEATALSDDSEQVQPAGKGNRKKAKKEQKTAPEENSRVGKSKKTRKQQNEKADGEEAMEELESINSQSSLIYELIEKAPSALSVGDQPEELKKYCILTSDSDSEH